jgi:hypothetical protein
MTVPVRRVMMQGRDVGPRPSDFCRGDAWAICQALIAVGTLAGTFWSIGVLL